MIYKIINFIFNCFGWLIIIFLSASFFLDIFWKPSLNQYQILFSLTGLTATFAALALSASNNNNSEHSKKKYIYQAGLDLFMATILFAEIILIRYFFDLIRSPQFYFYPQIIKAKHGIFCLRTALTIIAILGSGIAGFAFGTVRGAFSSILKQLET